MMKRILILALCVAAVAAIAIFAFGEQAQTLIAGLPAPQRVSVPAQEVVTTR